VKRSNSIRLLLLGTGLISLTACDQSDRSAHPIYKSEKECQQQNDPAECAAAFQTAKAEHEKTAPRFANLMECETKFGVGNCAEDPATQSNSAMGHPHSGFFMPMMMGYMMGNMARGMGAQPVYTTRGRPFVGNAQTFRGQSNYTSSSSRTGGFGRTGFLRGFHSFGS
jgi:uncharacterized protein YgiB involved in biofilm formation